MSFSLPVDAVLEWVLASVRVLAVLTAAPLFGHTAIPRRIRMSLALLVAWVIHPSMDPANGLAEASALALGVALLGEALTGFAIGLLSQLIFAAFGLLGEFISIQGGLGAARVIDPASGASSVALASVFQVFALLVFLAIDGHHMLLTAVAESFTRMPPGGGSPDASAYLEIAHAGSVIFSTALRLSLPVTVAMMVANSALGLLGRAIPQLNLMTLQLPAHVAILLALVIAGAQGLVEEMAAILTPWTQELAATVLP